MTLVLGTCIADAVILGAHSKTHVYTFDWAGSLLNIDSCVDRKLFKLARTGIATYGTGPVDIRVPTALTAELHSDWSVLKVLCYLQSRFRGADGMGALVGGLDATGKPVLYDVSMDGSEPNQLVPQMGFAPAVVLRGVHSRQVDQRAPGTLASVLSQMQEALYAAAGADVGPPYEFLVIPAV
jgi:hypothetical protein